jgi:hypothetical protein
VAVAEKVFPIVSFLHKPLQIIRALFRDWQTSLSVRVGVLSNGHVECPVLPPSKVVDSTDTYIILRMDQFEDFHFLNN